MPRAAVVALVWVFGGRKECCAPEKQFTEKKGCRQPFFHEKCFSFRMNA
jgi:hypothetical protein